MGNIKNSRKYNYRFEDNALLNELTYIDILKQFKDVCLSMFEWVNLPSSMNADFLEETLFYNGQATILKDINYGFINTKCCSNGKLNIYNLPTSLHCYSFEYQTNRNLYTGLLNEEDRKNKEFKECILVKNNWQRTPTSNSIELFAYRLYEAQRTADVNLTAQKTPVLILVDEKQRLTLQNLYSQYEGNMPIIFGDAKNIGEKVITAIKTDAPFICNELMDYKKKIWNELLTFLGINNIIEDKKERLVSDEANGNNELINYNLQKFLAPRQNACKQFNEKFGFTGTDKEISVRLRSDLHNIIKNKESKINDLINNSNDLINNSNELINNSEVVK